MRILAISGSLRAASSNSRLIEALTLLAPPGVEVVVWRGLNDLPHFNPDLETPAPPEPVLALRRLVGETAGLVICSPEYAHGVAGAMKNALDWLVPSIEFPNTPVALINAAPHAVHAQAQMRETLTMMNAALVDEACIAIPLAGRPLSAEAIAEDAELAGALRQALAVFAAAAGELAGARLSV